MDALSLRLTQRGSPFEIKAEVVGGVECSVFPRGPQTLQQVYRKAGTLGARELVVSGTTRLSYEQAFSLARKYSCAIRHQLGPSRRGRVAIWLDNSPEWIVCFIATTLAGAVPVLVHAEMDGDAALDCFEMAGCDLIITSAEQLRRVNQIKKPSALLLVDTSAGGDPKEQDLVGGRSVRLADLIREGYVAESACMPVMGDPSPDEDALIAFTSGTTDRPKGVLLSHRNLITGLMNMMLGGALLSARNPRRETSSKPAERSNPPSCTLVLWPLSHIGGYAQVLLMTYLGGKILLLPEWNPDTALALMEREKVRSLAGASVAMLKALIRRQHAADFDLSSLTGIGVHGAAVHSSLIDEIASVLPRTIVGTGYGMTETCGSISVTAGEELLANPASSGVLLPSVAVRIVDDSGLDVPNGDVGEIWVRGAMVMRGYCGVEPAAQALRDGWLRTGDLGRIDSAGNLYIVERVKDVLHCGAVTLIPGEVERDLASHPAVDEVAVISIGAEGRGERVVLVVLPRADTLGDTSSVQREIRTSMLEKGVEPVVVCVESLPRTVSGKTDRRALRRQIAERLGA